MASKQKKIDFNDILKLRRLYKLKEVERQHIVGKRHESSAEHTYSCLILADFFIPRMKVKLDRLKVYELLLYHDVVEIETGDVSILDIKRRLNKQKDELKAANTLRKILPKMSGEKFHKLFLEFEEEKTLEAKFAKSIDRLDAIIHLLDYKSLWKNWSEEQVRSFNQNRLSHFIEIEQIFEDIISYVKKEKYIKS